MTRVVFATALLSACATGGRADTILALTGDDIALLRNKRCALQLAGPAVSLALRRVRLSGSEVGTNLQVADFDLAALQVALQEEQYDHNGEDVAFSQVEIPDPTALLGDAVPP